VQAIDYKHIVYTSSIENPRVGGSIPPLGTIFTFRSIAYAPVDFTKISSNT
jgi:hypothetical protein